MRMFIYSTIDYMKELTHLKFRHGIYMLCDSLITALYCGSSHSSFEYITDGAYAH